MLFHEWKLKPNCFLDIFTTLKKSNLFGYFCSEKKSENPPISLCGKNGVKYLKKKSKKIVRFFFLDIFRYTMQFYLFTKTRTVEKSF